MKRIHFKLRELNIADIIFQLYEYKSRPYIIHFVQPAYKIYLSSNLFIKQAYVINFGQIEIFREFIMLKLPLLLPSQNANRIVCTYKRPFRKFVSIISIEIKVSWQRSIRETLLTRKL